MKRFGRSERIFIGIGGGLVVLSLILLFSHYSFVRWFHPPTENADGFRAAYSEPIPAAAKVVTQPAPSSLNEFGADLPDPGVFLLAPMRSALLAQKPAGHSTPILFRFEVYPRFTGSRFELIKGGKVISIQVIKGNATGKYALELLLSEPGSYQWQVKALDSTSELRTLTLRSLN